MADPFIDQSETLIYGKHACEQMAKICLGRIPALDGMVQFAIARQEQANADMKVVLDKQPVSAVMLDGAAVLKETRDTIGRFASYLNSLKGYPVNPKVFFRNDNPSDVARRRLVKLAGAVGHIVTEIPRHPAITDPTWLTEFTALEGKLQALKGTQLDAKVEKVDLGPEVAAERDRWLATYNANKMLVRGLLGHANKPDLLPLVFDDLAEIHHLAGVSDLEPEVAPPPPVAPPVAPAAVPAVTQPA